MDVTLWASTYGVDSAERERLGGAMARTLARLLDGRGREVELSPKG